MSEGEIGKSAKEIFSNVPETKTTNFYRKFLINQIIQQVSEKVSKRYIIEDFDDDTGDAKFVRNMSETETIEKFKSLSAKEFINIDKVEFRLVEGVPIAISSSNNIPEGHHSNSGAFVIMIGQNLSGLVLLDYDDGSHTEHNLQHELVHFAVGELGIGSLETVYPRLDEEDFIDNPKEVGRYSLACKFIDEALAYGTNFFNLQGEITGDDIKAAFFYKPNRDVVFGYNLDKNAEILANIFNQTVQDRSGKTQFRFNYYLIKHVKSLDDLDFTKPEAVEKFTNITSIKI